MQLKYMSSFVAKTRLISFQTSRIANHFHNLSDREKHLSLFQRPSTMNVEEIEDAELQLELLDLKSNEVMKDIYQEQSILQFYSRLEEDAYPVLLKNACFLDYTIWKHIPL